MPRMSKEEARKEHDRIMKEYCILVDKLAEVQDTATIEKKLAMLEERGKKLTEAENLRKDYQLNHTEEDARKEVAGMEMFLSSFEGKHDALVALDPTIKQDLEQKKAAARQHIEDYKKYHGI